MLPPKTKNGIPRLAIGLAAAVIAAGTLVGCSSSPSYDRSQREFTYAGGAHWPASIAIASGDGRMGGASDPLATRRDAELGVGSPGPMLAHEQWPTPPRASVTDGRRVYIPRREETLLFFTPNDRSDVRAPLWRRDRRHR